MIPLGSKSKAMGSTYSQIYIQVVFAVKGRNNLIQPDWEERLYQYITGIVQNKSQKMLAINGVSNHIHFLIGMQPSCCLSDLVREIKKSSNKFINENKIRLHQGDNDPGQYGGEKKERKVFQYTFHVTGSEKITVNNKVYTEPVIVEDTNSRALPWLREHALLPKGKGWFAAGYGAFRRLARENKIIVPSLQTPLRYTNFFTQFVEDQALEAFETWLVYLDYRLSKSPADSIAKKQKEWGISAINKLLPPGNTFDHIDTNGNIWFDVNGTKGLTIKCAYCESHITHVGYAHIEHYRPKIFFSQFCFDWDNLLLGCSVCNGARYKGTKFPDEAEKGPIINPVDENPDKYLSFEYDPETGTANVLGKHDRGSTTVDITGLNRVELIRHRSDVVRKIAFVAIRAKNGDVQAIEELNRCCENDQEYAAFARTLKRKFDIED